MINMTITTFGQYDYTAFDSWRTKTIQYDSSKVDVLTISTTQIDETFGRRYIKGIQHIGNENPLSFGNAQAVTYNENTHYHNIDGIANGGCITCSTSKGTSPQTVSYQHKFVLLGNKKIRISPIQTSLPLGTICISKQKPNFTSGFTPLESNYLYVGAASAGGSQYHQHTPSTGSVSAGTCGANYDVPTAVLNKDSVQVDNSSSGPLGYGREYSFNNEIVDRTELFLSESSAYYPDRDFTLKDTTYLQNKAQSIPSGYTEVVISQTGLLRFADIVGDLLSEGGTLTHTHTIYSGTSWCTTGSSRPYMTGITTDNHMPTYTAVRIIKKN